MGGTGSLLAWERATVDILIVAGWPFFFFAARSLYIEAVLLQRRGTFPLAPTRSKKDPVTDR